MQLINGTTTTNTTPSKSNNNTTNATTTKGSLTHLILRMYMQANDINNIFSLLEQQSAIYNFNTNTTQQKSYNNKNNKTASANTSTQGNNILRTDRELYLQVLQYLNHSSSNINNNKEREERYAILFKALSNILEKYIVLLIFYLLYSIFNNYYNYYDSRLHQSIERLVTLSDQQGVLTPMQVCMLMCV